MVPAALLAYALLAWFRPRLALGVLLSLIPFGHLVRFSIAGVPFTFPEVAVYVLTAVLVLQRLSALPLTLPLLPRIVSGPSGGGEKNVWFRDPWIALSILWILVAAVSAAYSPNPLRAWGIWKAYFVGPVLLFWAIRSLWGTYAHVGSSTETQNAKRKTQNDWHLFVFPLALGAFIVAAIAIAQRWWPIGVPYPWSLPGKFRATSVFGYPNAVGLYLAPLVPILVGAALSSFRSLRAAAKQSRRSARMDEIATGRWPSALAMAAWWGAIAATIVAIILAKSTGALVALVGTLPVLLYFVWRTNYKIVGHTYSYDREHRCAVRGGVVSVAILVGWIAVSLFLAAWLPYRHEQPTWGPPIVQKLTFQKWSGSVRLAQYRETWQLLRDHPIRGAGLAGYQTAIAPYHEDARVEIFLYPHNLLLAIWVELGLAGVLLFLAMLYQFFRAVFSIQYSVFSIAMVVILVHGFVDVPYLKNDLAMVFWVIMVLAVMDVGRGRVSPDNEKSAA